MDTVGPPTTTAPLPRTARATAGLVAEAAVAAEERVLLTSGLRTICTILSRMDGT
ncbi:hypothetical protein LINPERPRIM_LOCUS3944 [Linum perenne]